MKEKRTGLVRQAREAARNINRRVFLAFEGEKTEDEYFKGIEDNRQILGILPDIEIVRLAREKK